MTYDFWVAYMSWNISLSSMKQLTLNSIYHSSLPDDLKQDQLNNVKLLWSAWIQDVLQLL